MKKHTSPPPAEPEPKDPKEQPPKEKKFSYGEYVRENFAKHPEAMRILR